MKTDWTLDGTDMVDAYFAELDAADAADAEASIRFRNPADYHHKETVFWMRCADLAWLVGDLDGYDRYLRVAWGFETGF